MLHREKTNKSKLKYGRICTLRGIGVDAIKGGPTLPPIITYERCFKKSFTTLETYINIFRGHVQCFELS
jgi:hypothetical protein